MILFIDLSLSYLTICFEHYSVLTKIRNFQRKYFCLEKIDYILYFDDEFSLIIYFSYTLVELTETTTGYAGLVSTVDLTNLVTLDITDSVHSQVS